MTHPSSPIAHIIGGRELTGASGADATSLDPYTGEVVWSCADVDGAGLDEAVSSARSAFPAWSRRTFEERVSIVERFTQLVKDESERLALLIAREAGKPIWESKIEVNSLVTKLAASVDAYKLRCAELGREVKGLQSKTRFVPHGVMAVLGPFNFPASMANSHITPALLAGNTVIFKPSELTPQTGVEVARLWQRAGLPPGVLSCLSGGRATGQRLVAHDGIDGVLFVGSHAAGLSILRTLVDKPEKIAALEMGGNSPLVVYDYDKDKEDAVLSVIVQSAFLSGGQRCSAARRLLVPASDTRIVDALKRKLTAIRIGHYQATPEPYYGPSIRAPAALAAVNRFKELSDAGASALLTPAISGPAETMVSPGLIDVTDCSADRDEEIFGPVLKVIRYRDLDEAIEIANATRFGLSAGIISKERGIYDEFYRRVRAGIVNWNQQLTGATTFAPFGGAKQSGNNRPAGFLSTDYCSRAVASFEVEADKLAVAQSPGLPF